MKKNKGITLVALVVTIIVLLILAGVSLSLVAGSDGILSKAGKAVDKNKVSTAKEIAELIIMDAQADYYDETYVAENYTGSKLDYITDKLKAGVMSSDYMVQAETGGKIKVYKGTGSMLETVATGKLTENGKMEWDGEASGEVVTNPTAGRNESSRNRTLANETSEYSYKNPVIPQGFKAVDIGGADWRYKDAEKAEVIGWNEGLVIEDVYNGNQFVWVPCTMEATVNTVAYAKDFSLPGFYGEENASDDENALPTGITEKTQIEKYEGFYVARYEAGFAGGDITGTTNDVSTIVPVSKFGEKVWNCISYTNAMEVSKLMINNATMYGSNKSGLITGTQWDTILAWYKKSGIGVEKTTQDWGSYYNVEYNINGFYYLNGSDGWKKGSFLHPGDTSSIVYHGSGLNLNGIKKNIADLGGNLLEWTNEKFYVYRGDRGGAANGKLGDWCIGTRNACSVEQATGDRGFREVIYVE